MPSSVPEGCIAERTGRALSTLARAREVAASTCGSPSPTTCWSRMAVVRRVRVAVVRRVRVATAESLLATRDILTEGLGRQEGHLRAGDLGLALIASSRGVDGGSPRRSSRVTSGLDVCRHDTGR
jgi:hypothetical protein